jgi:hypothetical protein
MSGFGVEGDVANGSFEEVAPFGAWGWRYYDDIGVRRVHDTSDDIPDGSHYLQLSNGAHAQQTNPASNDQTYTVTASIRGERNGDQAQLRLDFRDQGMGAGEVSPKEAYEETVTLTTAWQTYSLTATPSSGGNPVYASRVTFTAGQGSTVDIDSVKLSTGSPPPPPPPPPPHCEAAKIHVANLVSGTLSAGRGRKNARVTAIIHDNCGDPFANALLTGNFSGDFNEAVNGTSKSDGVVTLESTNPTRKPSYSFCVDSLSGTLEYEPENNADNVAICAP